MDVHRETARREWAELRRTAKARPAPTVNIAALSPGLKRAVWRHLQTRHPAIATLLASPALQSLREFFDADVYVDRALVAEVLDAHHD